MKINNASTLALAALLAVSEAAGDPANTPNLRGEVIISENEDLLDASNIRARELIEPENFHAFVNLIDCRKEMVDVEICFKTDLDPHENTVWIEDEDGEVVFEMGPFARSTSMYCREEQFCPGKYWLGIDDTYGDGTDRDFGEVIVRTRDKRLLDMTLYDFGDQYGPRKFVVEEEGGGNIESNPPVTMDPIDPVDDPRPFGSTNCRQCKDICAARNSGDSWAKKQCKKTICRVHYGRGPCND